MVEFLPVSIENEPFLLALYASTREDEVNGWGWSSEQKEAFLKMQYDFQQRAYRMQVPNAQKSLIIHKQEAIGQLTVDRSQGVLLLVDICLLPDYRNRGLGTHIIQVLQEDARLRGTKIQLHVQVTNSRARSLYERLDFRSIQDNGLYTAMEWDPS